MESLATCIRYDRFLKVIDLSANLIPEASFKALLKTSLKENQSLVSLSAVKNPGLTDKHRKQIALCLLRNIEAFRKAGVEIKPEWIKHENLAFKIPTRILETLGISKNNDRSAIEYTTSYTNNEESPSKQHRTESSSRKSRCK